MWNNYQREQTLHLSAEIDRVNNDNDVKNLAGYNQLLR